MIIDSLLDVDLYKLTMMQVIFHRFTPVSAEYTYKLRTKGIDLSDTKYTFIINEEFENLCSLKFKEDELNYLRSLEFFKEDFLEFLELFYLRMKHVEFDKSNFGLSFKGSWLYIMMWEIYALEIISEVYFSNNGFYKSEIYVEGEKKLDEKIQQIKEYNEKCNNTPIFKFADFGGRRRFSKFWHDHILEKLIEEVPHNLAGTSNIMFAKKFSLKPIGTMAHEYLQAFQALDWKLINSQKMALQIWAEEYDGKLGIALTDVITMDAFLKDFNLYFSKLFDGCRHDSGDPEEWCEKLINHYKNLGINPLSKTAVFSDGLDISKAIFLCEKFRRRINVSFGIGTNLTNDLGPKALNHVIKMTMCNEQDVAKISDSQGKTMCKNDEYVKYLKSVFNVK